MVHLRMTFRKQLLWSGILKLLIVLIRGREKELLFGPQSLLARYGPLIVEVCTKPEIYKVSTRSVIF